MLEAGGWVIWAVSFRVKWGGTSVGLGTHSDSSRALSAAGRLKRHAARIKLLVSAFLKRHPTRVFWALADPLAAA
jgi:hypothetical protein